MSVKAADLVEKSLHSKKEKRFLNSLLFISYVQKMFAFKNYMVNLTFKTLKIKAHLKH